MACRREPRLAAADVGFDDFYGFLSVSDMYTEWRDPHFFPEIVYSEARTEWVKNMPFNRCFVHAKRGSDARNVEEVTIPVLSLLDDKWCNYSADFIRERAGKEQPWFLYHNTRGAHFDNYPNEKFLGKSPAKHPYKDTLLELDDVLARLVEALRDTGQLEDTLIFISSDNGPHMETWPNSAFTPFRCAKGSTWEGGVRVPGIVYWPGTIAAGRQSDGIFDFNDILPTLLAIAGVEDGLPKDRYIDGVDQSSFLLTPDGLSNRKFHYYWLTETFSALRCGEYKMVLSATSDNSTDAFGPGRLYRRSRALCLCEALQPLSRPERAAQLHDPEARLSRRLPVGHPQSPEDVPDVAAEKGPGPACVRLTRLSDTQCRGCEGAVACPSQLRHSLEA